MEAARLIFFYCLLMNLHAFLTICHRYPVFHSAAGPRDSTTSKEQTCTRPDYQVSQQNDELCSAVIRFLWKNVPFFSPTLNCIYLLIQLQLLQIQLCAALSLLQTCEERNRRPQQRVCSEYIVALKG